jgi:hypothetical protein
MPLRYGFGTEAGGKYWDSWRRPVGVWRLRKVGHHKKVGLRSTSSIGWFAAQVQYFLPLAWEALFLCVIAGDFRRGGPILQRGRAPMFPGGQHAREYPERFHSPT